MLFNFKKSYFVKAVIVMVVSVLIGATPLNHHLQTNEVHATSVVVTGSVLQPSSAVTAIQSTADAISSKLLEIKEYILDNLAYTLINTIISNMIRSVTQWVQSGFQGSPAFVTDLEGFLMDAIDQTIGELINGTELGFLCSPFSLDIRIALNVQYQYLRSEQNSQCSLTGIVGNIENFLTGTFSEGGWQGWFELTQSSHADPTAAFLESSAEISAAILKTRDREITLFEANSGFLDVKLCDEVSVGPDDGLRGNNTRKENCKTTTPGAIVVDAVADTLGLPAERLTFADEINELIGALMQQLISQVLGGVGGLLGLGGGSYGSYDYGTSGNLSYLDALVEESLGDNTVDSQEIFDDAVENQYDYMDMMEGMLASIQAYEQDIANARTEYGSCIDTQLSSTLRTRKEEALQSLGVGNAALVLIEEYRFEYEITTSPDERSAILTDFAELYTGQGRPNAFLVDQINARGTVHVDPNGIVLFTESDVRLTRVDMQINFPTELSSARNQLRANERQCEEERNADGGGDR